MRSGLTAATLLATALVVSNLGVYAQAVPTDRPVRLFESFVGTWVLDEAASTGQMTIVPRVPVTLTIATTPTEITLSRRVRLQPGDRVSDTPPTEVYRLDGSETELTDSRSGVPMYRVLRFAFVADMLALTIRDAPRKGHGFTQVTDALEIDGAALKLHRQLTSVSEAGAIYVMATPAGNVRQTFVYRRQ